MSMEEARQAGLLRWHGPRQPMTPPPPAMMHLPTATQLLSPQSTIFSQSPPSQNKKRVTREVSEDFIVNCTRAHPEALRPGRNVRAVWINCKTCDVHVSFRKRLNSVPTHPSVAALLSGW